jgi:uncharacterized protein (TIRG00374 family)
MNEKTLHPDPQAGQAAVPEAAAPENGASEAMPAMEMEKPPEPAWKKTLKFILRFGVSAGILTYIICTRDIKWQDFMLVKPWCIAVAFLCIYTQLSLTAVRWFTLLRAAGVKCSFREAFSLQMQGMFFSQFLPGGSVGGDVVKAGILATRTPPGGKFNVVFSIFVDRLCGLGALLMALLGTCLVCHATIAQFPEGQRNGLLVMCAVCGALLCVVVFVFFSDLLYKVKFFKFFLDIADRITKDTFRRAADAVALYRRRWKMLLAWIVATTLVFFPVLGMPVWLLANGFENVQEPEPVPAEQTVDISESDGSAQESADAPVAEQAKESEGIKPEPKRDFLSCLMISNVSQTIAAIPGSFGGTGTRDIAGAEMMTAMGFSKKESGVIPILVTMLTLLVALSCSVFFIFDRGKRAGKQ